MDKNIEQSLIGAAMDYFGKNADTGLKGFRDEWQALTTADKAEIKDGLIAEGYKIKE